MWFPDANECLEDNVCDTYADCTNTEGSYTCKCKDGYTGSGKECTKGEFLSHSVRSASVYDL